MNDRHRDRWSEGQSHQGRERPWEDRDRRMDEARSWFGGNDRDQWRDRMDQDQDHREIRQGGATYGMGQNPGYGGPAAGYGQGDRYGQGNNPYGGPQGFGDQSRGHQGYGGSQSAGQGYGGQSNFGGGYQGGSQYGGYGGPSDYTGAYGSRQGQGQDQSRQGQQDRHDHEPDYLHWREQQMARFDKDYADWRNERRQKFSSDFETWRNGRPENPAVGDVSDGGHGDQHAGEKKRSSSRSRRAPLAGSFCHPA
jgi:hypothetical protein